ncbi:Gustatory receptor 90c [Halyomorpha halys]|nr:Gustatory receptor 90c [Halyomorpha halys]
MSLLLMFRRRRDLDDIFGRALRLSRLLCMFPFYITKKSLYISNKYLFLSIVLVVFVNAYSIIYLNEMGRRSFFKGSKLIMYSHFFPAAVMALLPACNLLWLIYKKEKLVEIFRTILDLEVLTGYTSPDPDVHIAWTLFMIMFCHFGIHAALLLPYNHKQLFGACIYNIYSSISLFILIQFHSFTTIIQSHYQNMLDTLKTNSVKKLCRAHEKLGRCCRFISDCYSPQLLLMTCSMFVKIICQSYQAIMTDLNDVNSVLKLRVVFGIRVILNCIIIFYITYLSSATMKKAKKFDNMVYYMIMNDPTKTLVKNKRIIIHFKANRKEEFSAMGFFNFDYPLLCSMVSSATTYIVILIQFS